MTTSQRTVLRSRTAVTNVSFVFGTRPEAIKLCPLILAMREHPALRVHVCVTGQHRQMLDQVLEVFQVVPDIDLALMQANQCLAGLTSRAIVAIDGYLARHTPEMVIVQGDTTTVFCAALAAFYRQIPVAHVEAGLRTGDKFSPFPEEINRTITTKLADLHFAPTGWARQNLLREGVDPKKVIITGNTVIDALFFALKEIERHPPHIAGLPPEVMSGQTARRLVLITGHRREHFGLGFENICRAVARLAGDNPTVDFVYPVHFNPNVREPVFRLLGARANVYLIAPQNYLPFIALMKRARFILTDSGGVQEEAPSLGKPVLVMRNTTERPEGVEAGVVRLVGTDPDGIYAGASGLLEDSDEYRAMSRASNPYGDGNACGRIIDAIVSAKA